MSIKANMSHMWEKEFDLSQGAQSFALPMANCFFAAVCSHGSFQETRSLLVQVFAIKPVQRAINDRRSVSQILMCRGLSCQDSVKDFSAFLRIIR